MRSIEKIETAVEPAFQEHFVHAMAIPNGLDPFTELAKEVTLPVSEAPSQPQSADGGRKNRRRSRSR